MTMIIVDTDVLIEIFDKQSMKGKTGLKELEISSDDIAITSSILHEILYAHYNRNKNRFHPVLLVALVHLKVVSIHPFGDGNGRISSLIDSYKIRFYNKERKNVLNKVFNLIYFHLYHFLNTKNI